MTAAKGNKNGQSRRKPRTVTTSKKLRVLGHKQITDNETGEVIDCELVKYEERDANFLKFWVYHVLSLIEDVSNAKTQIIFYILENINRTQTNVLTKTVAEIVTETGFSKPTVLATLAAMERHDIIRRKTGVIFLNPNTVFKGSTNKRRALLIEYLQLKPSLPDD